MKFSIYLLIIPLLISLSHCKTKRGDTQLTTWEQSIFQDQSKLIKAKLWRDSRGGRSWTIEDEEGYDRWLATVPDTLFLDWDIPHDCADVILALRFIYAIAHGLALKIGIYQSTDYWHDPLLMLRRAVNDYGTVNLNEISYKVDMWDNKNYQGGNFILHRQTGYGHAFQLTSFSEFFLFNTLESTTPATLRKMINSSLFESTIKHRSFRRLYAIKREGAHLFHDLSVSFAAHPKQSLEKPDWYQCIGTPDSRHPDLAPLWKNIFHFKAMESENPQLDKKRLTADGITCPHNVYWKERYQVDVSFTPQAPGYKQVLTPLFNGICLQLNSRSKAVEIGYRNCHLNPSKRCSAHKSAAYSTPAKDDKIRGLLKKYLGLIFSSNLTETPISLCPLKIWLSSKDYLRQSVQIINDANEITPWAENIFFNGLIHHNPSDPKEDLTLRWGCHPMDKNWNCLKTRTTGDFLKYAISFEKDHFQKQRVIGFQEITAYSIEDGKEEECTLQKGDVVLKRGSLYTDSEGLFEVIQTFDKRDGCSTGLILTLPFEGESTLLH